MHYIQIVDIKIYCRMGQWEKIPIACEENLRRIFSSSFRDARDYNNCKNCLKVMYKDKLTNRISYNIIITDMLRQQSITIVNNIVRRL